MIRRVVLSLALLGAAPVAGQYRGSRSAEYLFAANVADARALWVNPAGLGVEHRGDQQHQCQHKFSHHCNSLHRSLVNTPEG